MSFLLSHPAEVSLAAPPAQLLSKAPCVYYKAKPRQFQQSLSQQEVWGQDFVGRSLLFQANTLKRSVFRVGGCEELYPRREHAVCLCKEPFLQCYRMSHYMPAMYHVSSCLHHYIWNRKCVITFLPAGFKTEAKVIYNLRESIPIFLSPWTDWVQSAQFAATKAFQRNIEKKYISTESVYAFQND